MKVIEIVSFGAPEVLRWANAPCRFPGKGELRIRVTASGVNRPDVLQRTGSYPVPPGASDIPGLEVAGVIDQGMRRPWRKPVSRSVTACVRWWRVAVMPNIASRRWASACLYRKAERCEAASLPETVFTVWSNVFDRARLQPGETLLVQGGSSGIGVTAIQIAQSHGLHRHRDGGQ
jgi:NADPH2:quinone reductase